MELFLLNQISMEKLFIKTFNLYTQLLLKYIVPVSLKYTFFSPYLLPLPKIMSISYVIHNNIYITCILG